MSRSQRRLRIASLARHVGSTKENAVNDISYVLLGMLIVVGILWYLLDDDIDKML